MTAVKPLVWEHDKDFHGGWWTTMTPFGWINVYPVPSGVRWYWMAMGIKGDNSNSGYPTADAAKAGAEARWEEAVLKCLTRTEE